MPLNVSGGIILNKSITSLPLENVLGNLVSSRGTAEGHNQGDRQLGVEDVEGSANTKMN